ESFALGGAANVAANVVRLGASCEIVGFAGGDGPGEQLRQRIGSLDGGTVHARLIADGSRPTTTTTRGMARRHQVVRFDREVDADLGEAAERAIRDAAREAVRAADVVVLEDYNKGVLSAGVIRAVIDEASRLERPVVVDPKFRNIFDYAG